MTGEKITIHGIFKEKFYMVWKIVKKNYEKKNDRTYEIPSKKYNST